MAETLRGKPDGLMTTIPKGTPKYGARVDGTPKGIGFFGEIARSDDPEMFSTELSITVDDRLIPALVPTLSAEEIAHLVDGGSLTQSIVEKAIAFAESRTKAGKSPFAEPGEQVPLPKASSTQMQEGFDGRSIAP